MKQENLLIIGSGPAGYTAALYAARANLSPLVLEGFYSGPIGGQLTTTTDVENYPGFPKGVEGPHLVELFKEQATRFGARFISEDVNRVEFGSCPFTLFTPTKTLQALSVIIATGASANRLSIPGAGEGEFWQKGVTACAVCDGAAPIFRNHPLFVIGGGDSAIEEALFLTKFGSHVTIVHRRDQLRASKIMQQRALSHPKISVLWDSVVVEVQGDTLVRSLLIQNVKTGIVAQHPAAGLFFAVGHTPNTAFLAGQVEMHPNGYIKVFHQTTETSCPGVFAAGDVQDFRYRQAITAAGSGCMAAIDAERWLTEQNLLP